MTVESTDTLPKSAFQYIIISDLFFALAACWTYFAGLQSEPTGLQEKVNRSDLLFSTLNPITWKGKNILQKSWASARGKNLQKKLILNYLGVTHLQISP